MQYAAPLACMAARKKARLSQKELAGQLMKVDMDIIDHGAWRESPNDAI